MSEPDPEGARHAALAFGLEAARVIEALAGSTQNDNWLLEDASGRRLVLRHCRRNADMERQRWQRGLERHLEGAGFPVPAVLATTDGATVVEVDGEPWTLSAFVRGEEYDYASMAQVGEAGRRLATFHLLCAVRAHGDARATSALSHAPRGHYLLGAEWELRALRQRLTGAGFEEDLAATRELGCRDARGVADRTLRRAPARAHSRRLPRSQPDLRELGGGGAAGLRQVEPGPFVLDLVRAIPAFARPKRGSYEIRVDVGRRFIEGYEQVRRLADDEGLAIPGFAALWGAPIDVFYDLHPTARLEPLKSARADFTHWHQTMTQRGALEEVVDYHG